MSDPYALQSDDPIDRWLAVAQKRAERRDVRSKLDALVERALDSTPEGGCVYAELARLLVLAALEARP